jgi:hypothetical protein
MLNVNIKETSKEVKPISKNVSKSDFEALKRRVKKLEEVTENISFITDFNWDWNQDSKKPDNTRAPEDTRLVSILSLLYKNQPGLTTTQIATELNMINPQGSGRVIVRRKLLKAIRVSKRIRGAPIVVRSGRHWQLNYDEFAFQIKEDQNEKVSTF